MALKGWLRCLKYLVFSLNFLFWIAGMCVLGLAVWMRMDPQTNHFIKADYSDDINSFYIITYILMGAGGVMTFVGFLGCCGTFQESRCMLGTFCVFLCLIFIAEVAGGIWAFVHRDQVKSSVTQTFTDAIQKQYHKDTIIQDSLDFVQKTLECCGGKSPADWKESQWAKAGSSQANSVPTSCCIENRQPKRVRGGMCGVVKPSNTVAYPGVHSKGCGEELITFFQHNLAIMIGLGLGLGALQLLGMIFTLTLFCAMRRRKRNNGNPTK